jgi:D-alanyl-D-alanine endopeptidase (penicillin-binding protein 7)
MPDSLFPLRAIRIIARRLSASLILRASAAAVVLTLPMMAHAGSAGTAQSVPTKQGKTTNAGKAGGAATTRHAATVSRGEQHPTHRSKVIYRSRTHPASSTKHRAPARRAAVATPASLNLDPYTPDELSDGPRLHSAVAYMVDQNTGTVLVDKNSSAVVPIASISKLMTAMVVLDSGASLAEPIQVSEEDKDFEKHTGSRLKIGAVLSREDMLHIALMASENRAAAALSRYYPGGRPAFIAAMNEKARALGMTDTHFENPAGLSKYNVSSARDLVKMVEAAAHYPLIRLYSTDRSYTVSSGKGTLDYHSTNMLLGDSDWEIGLQKTGFINESGICLVMQTTVDDRPVVMVLLNSNRRHADFMDAEHLRTALQSHAFPSESPSRNIAKTDTFPM